MKKLTLIIVVVFISKICFGQVSGYQGNRFSIAYNADISPALLSPLANTDMSSSGPVGFNLCHGGELDYVIKKRTAVCLGVQFLKTGVTYKKSYETGEYTSISNTIRYNGETPVGLKTINFSIGLKFFKRNFIAPVGKYGKLDLVLYSGKIIFDKNNFTHENNYFPIVTDEFSYNTIGIGYTIGKQRVFFNRLVVDTGIRFGFIPAAFFRLMREADIVTAFDLVSDDDSFETQIKTNSHFRLAGAQLVNFHIGIGFLAF